MTLTVTYRDLRNQNFLRVIGRIGSYPFKNQKVSYNIMRICKKIESEIKLADAQFQKTLKEYALLDEKGEFVPDKKPDGSVDEGTFQIPPEKQDAWQKVYDEFCDLPVVIQQDALKLEHFEEMKIAPAELGMIEALIEPPQNTPVVVAEGTIPSGALPPGISAPIPLRK